MTHPPQPADPGLPPAQERFIPTLDGWRAIAIIGVLIAHQAPSQIAAAEWLLTPVLLGGRIGVELFFGISGYLITTRLLKEHDSTGEISLRSFYLRRFFRILPPAFVYLAVISLLGVVGLISVTPAEVLSCIFFFKNYSLGSCYYLQHFWTLSMEEHFYLFWPGLLLLLRMRHVVPVTLALIAAVTVWRSIDFRYHIINGRLIDEFVFAMRSDIRIDTMLSGCLFALITHTPRGKALLTRLLPSVMVVPLVAIYMYCLLRDPRMAFLIRALVVPMILLSAILSPASLMSRALDWSVMRWVGRLSYSIYIWQELFTIARSHVPPFLGSLQRFPLNLVAVLIVSYVSYRFVEQPSIRFGQRLAQKA